MTEKAQNEDFRRKPEIFADSPLLLEVEAFGGCRFSFAENRRFSQNTAGNRRLGSVTLGPSPLARPYLRCPSWLVRCTVQCVVWVPPVQQDEATLSKEIKFWTDTCLMNLLEDTTATDGNRSLLVGFGTPSASEQAKEEHCMLERL